jgi:hypothetical protein
MATVRTRNLDNSIISWFYARPLPRSGRK